MERETGFEPATPSLEGWRSSQLSYSRLYLADSGLRISSSKIHNPLSAIHTWWGGEDSNLRRLTPTGLQPVPFGHSGTSPKCDETSNLLTCLYRKIITNYLWIMEPPEGLEPTTG